MKQHACTAVTYGLPLFNPDGRALFTMGRAKRARDQVMATVADNAGEKFGQEAARFVVSYLRVHGATAGEDLTDACKRVGIVPHDDRAFGPVYMRLSRAGLIEKAGYVPRRKGHGTSGGSVWKLRKER